MIHLRKFAPRQQGSCASGIMAAQQSPLLPMRSGILSATLAFLCWGLFPLYYNAIGEVTPL